MCQHTISKVTLAVQIKWIWSIILLPIALNSRRPFALINMDINGVRNSYSYVTSTYVTSAPTSYSAP